MFNQEMAHRALILPDQMAKVDARTIAAGTPGITLMERAGAAVTRVIRGRWHRRPVRVLCGPGQNGGDGWVIARLLREAGWPVEVYSDWPADKLSGDAQIAAQRCAWPPRPLGEAADPFISPPLVVDALFGAGLSRPLKASLADLLEAIARPGVPVVAVDLPSGLDGATGEARGAALNADATVTFERLKPGHVLSAGPALCGALFVAPIGLEVADADAVARHNHPSLWWAEVPLPPTAAHKYARGGVLVLSGPRHQGGAARLTAYAAARAGAGAVTLAATGAALDIHAAHLDAPMVARADDPAALAALANSKRTAAVVVGPGLEGGEAAQEAVLALLSVGKPAVVDASALTMFETEPDRLVDALPPKAVLTPHEGEFRRLFPDVEGDPLTRAVAAATRCGRTVLLKGASTVIATPGEVPVINTHASPYLATAGSGDTLAGIIAGLMAQEVGAHIAAAAGAWIHGDAAQRLGPGLTADDLAGAVPEVLAGLADQAE